MSSEPKGAVFYARSHPTEGTPQRLWILALDSDNACAPSSFCGLVITPSNAWLMSWDDGTSIPVKLGLDEYAIVACPEGAEIRELALCSPGLTRPFDHEVAVELLWEAGKSDLGWKREPNDTVLGAILRGAQSAYTQYYRKSVLSAESQTFDLRKYLGLTTLRVWRFSPKAQPAEAFTALLMLVDQLLCSQRDPRSLPDGSYPVVDRKATAGHQQIEMSWPSVIKTIRVPCGSISPLELKILQSDIQRVVGAWRGVLTVISLRY